MGPKPSLQTFKLHSVFELAIKPWGLSFELWNLSAKISGLGALAFQVLEFNFGRLKLLLYVSKISVRSWDGITTLQAIRLPCATQLLYMPW